MARNSFLFPLATILSLLCMTNGVASGRAFSAPNEPSELKVELVKASFSGATGRGLLQAGATPAPQEVIDAAINSFVYLLKLNSGVRNPLVTFDVPCEEYQPEGGPYILIPPERIAPGVPNPFPTPARTCTFLEGAPVLIAILFDQCFSACSPDICDCCDGSLKTLQTSTVSPPPNGTCPLYPGTDCSYCADRSVIAAQPSPNAALYATTLTDLTTDTTIPLEIYYVPVTFAPTPELPPNSLLVQTLANNSYTYGPGAYLTGPVSVSRYYAYIQPSQLQRGHSYRVVRKAVSPPYPGSNGNLPVVYEFTVAGSSACDPTSAAPNQCFNAAGTASVCCPGQCRNPPLGIPSCQPGSTSTAGSSSPSGTLAPGKTCDPYGPRPNQCFNAPGSSSVCCSGSCPNKPGPEPFCG